MKALIAAALLLLAASGTAGAVGTLADVTVYDRAAFGTATARTCWP
jgi:uncharacterized PurR-regulated membrane protein YhhQ (DUF165 family)